MPDRFIAAIQELYMRISTVEKKLGIESGPPILTFDGSEEEAKAAIDALRNMGINVIDDPTLATNQVVTLRQEDEISVNARPNPELEKELNKPLATMDDEYGPYIVRYRLPNGHVLIWKRANVSEYNKYGYELSVLTPDERATKFAPVEKNDG